MATKSKTAAKTSTAKPAKDPRGSSASATPDASPTGGVTTQTHLHHAATDGETSGRARRKLDDDPVVTVRIPRAFNLQVLDDKGSRIIRYEAGVDEMPKSHAKHDYAIANGVEVVE